MCLSPEFDLAAAAVTGLVAVDTLRRNRNSDARLLAAIPAVFAVHNVASAVMWWGLLGDVGPQWGRPAANLYMFVAFVLWPAYVPLAVRSMETVSLRRNLLAVVWILGMVNAGWHLWRLSRGQMTPVAHEHYISFDFPADPVWVGPLYGLATSGATFFSSHRELVMWGIVNAGAVAVLTVWAAAGLPSLWCWWAALTSVFINWFIRGHDRRLHGALA